MFYASPSDAPTDLYILCISGHTAHVSVLAVCTAGLYVRPWVCYGRARLPHGCHRDMDIISEALSRRQSACARTTDPDPGRLSHGLMVEPDGRSSWQGQCQGKRLSQPALQTLGDKSQTIPNIQQMLFKFCFNVYDAGQTFKNTASMSLPYKHETLAPYSISFLWGCTIVQW